tara:strand:+ start:76 stop:321 length:246 start_codon:yes stop_codon:yes gene_type:complete
MENFIQKIAVSISEIKKGGTDADTEKQLSNLWENVCRYKRASEVIRVGYSHTEETVKKSKTEINRLSDASCDKMINSIIIQ